MTTRITIERQELAGDAQRIAMQLSKLAAHAAEEGLDLAGPVESMTDELSGMTVALTAGRDLHCRCGAAALEMAYWPRTGRAGMAGTLDALMRGDEMVGHTVCIKHAEGSYVGHALCPCGDRAGYIATMGPDAARRARRYDPDLWVEYDDGLSAVRGLHHQRRLRVRGALAGQQTGAGAGPDARHAAPQGARPGGYGLRHLGRVPHHVDHDRGRVPQEAHPVAEPSMPSSWRPWRGISPRRTWNALIIIWRRTVPTSPHWSGSTSWTGRSRHRWPGGPRSPGPLRCWRCPRSWAQPALYRISTIHRKSRFVTVSEASCTGHKPSAVLY